MKIVEEGLKKGYERQKNSLLKQIEVEGMKLVNLTEMDDEESKTASAVTSTLKSIVGGKLSPDHWQIYEIEYRGRNQVYVQPYSGSTILPGEHHLYIKGGIDAPIILEDTALFGGPVWSSSNKEFAKRLNKQEKELKKAVKKVKLEWPIGASKIEHEWGVQIFNKGNGFSKLVMKAGRYGGISTYDVGFNVLNQIVDAVSPVLSGSAQKQIALKMANYDDLVEPLISSDEIMSDQSSTTERVEKTEEEYRTIITNVVKPYVDKQIFLSEIPEKKENNFRTIVMPQSHSGDVIVAAFDTTIFGSAKTGVVFTPTHCFAKDDNLEVAFELKDLVSLASMTPNKEDQLELVLTTGRVLLPISFQTEIIEVLAAIIN